MSNKIKERVIMTAELIINDKVTIREAAKQMGVSKSTVYNDMSERLPKINTYLAKEVSAIFIHHTNTKHLRGGEATRNKYKKI